MNTSTIFFSVIITVYNKEKFIYESLQSVFNQSYVFFEVIVVNDGSTDHSLLEIQKVSDDRIKTYTIKNQGVSNARNFGIEQSKEIYIAFLDGDDLWKKNHLEEIVKSIKEFPKESIFSTASCYSKNGIIKKHQYSIKDLRIQKIDYFKGSTLKSILHPSSLVLKKEVYLDIGGFNTCYSNAEDTEYWLRIGLKYKVIFSSVVSVIIRYADSSLSTKKFNIDNYCFFEEYDSIKTNNSHFYKVLDLNRFSLALLCREHGYNDKSKILINKINLKNLSKKQVMLLKLPSFAISGLKKLQSFLDKKGIKTSTY